MNGAAQHYGRAARAYASATATRSTGTPLERARALADTARLWNAMTAYLQDPLNALPVGTRAGLLSIGRTVDRCLAEASPDLDFLMAVNENIAAGLAAGS